MRPGDARGPAVTLTRDASRAAWMGVGIRAMAVAGLPLALVLAWGTGLWLKWRPRVTHATALNA